MRAGAAACVAIWSLLAAACSPAAPTSRSLGSADGGGLHAELSSDAGPLPTKNHFILTITDASTHQPVDGLTIVSSGQMAAMPMPVLTSTVQPLGKGRYSDQPELPMAGAWDYVVTISRGGVPVTTLHFSLEVQS
jgi:hypothetical protein